MSDSGMEPSVSEVLREVIARHQAGCPEEALRLCEEVLESHPDHPEALYLAGTISIHLGNAARAADLLRAAAARVPDSAEAHYNLGIAHQQSGALGEAEAAYRRAAEIRPDDAAAHTNLGYVLEELGRPEEAETALRRVLEFHPEDPTAHGNLGALLHRMGRNEEAEAACRRAIEIAPDNAEAHVTLGNILKESGRLEEAEVAYRRAIEIKPDDADAQSNLAAVLSAQGRIEEAEAACRRALALNPGHAEAHNNLGNALLGLGRLEEALAAYRRAVEIKPEHALAHGNLGVVLMNLGRAEAAIESCERALELKPGYGEAYNNVRFALALALPERGDGMEKGAASACIERLKAKEPLSPRPYFLDFFLDSLIRDRATDSYREATERLPKIADETLALGKTDRGHAAPSGKPRLPEGMCALLHFGRSGSGFLHSLIDGHPQVSTLPGAYMKGFFGSGVWEALTAGGPEGVIGRFSSLYEVLFDAYSPKGVPGIPTGFRKRLREAEGYTTMGEDRATPLRLDREAFGRNLSALLRGFARLHQDDFFRLAHAAFEATLGRPAGQELIFYHIHNPDDYEFANFLKYFPDAKLLLIVREPLQSCESWVSRDVEDGGGYSRCVNKIVGMLFQPDRVEFGLHESAGLRLEDLKNNPSATLKALCAWLGIDEAESLHASTMQGLRWWGEPSSPLFGDADQFGKAPLQRRPGHVFSDRDRFVLGTLFHPFSRRFGYTDGDRDRFARDLEAVGAMLDAPFDFERKYFEISPPPPGEMESPGMYRYLRVALRSRWRTLREHKTYPGMIAPLERIRNRQNRKGIPKGRKK